MCKKILFNALFLLLLFPIKWFCDSQTDGFRYHEIISAMPNDENWQLPAAPQDSSTKLLEQAFYFLGKGEQCYAFLGADGETVLKFFRHDHLNPKQLLRGLHSPFIDRLLSYQSRYDLSPLFASVKLAFTEFKEETGLILVHLNKTKERFPPVSLYDKLGIKHTIDLDATEFILQERAHPFCEALNQKMKKGDIEAAQEQIRSLITTLKLQCQKGITNTDASFKRNFGAIHQRTVILDVGSFLKDERVRSPEGQRREIQRLTARFARWLKTHYPELLPYYEKHLEL